MVGLLRLHGVHATVIELNHETLTKLREDGVRAVYGDASQRAVLEQAGVREAGSLIFAASGTPDLIVQQARALNPDLAVLARTSYLREVPHLQRAGAQVVVSAEAEVALAMAEHLLRQLGATADQLDRARDSVRRELLA